MRMRSWFQGKSVQTKLILAYAVFALLPMLLITIFTYNNTKKILLDRLYEELAFQMDFSTENLDEKANSYYAISNMFYMDGTLQSYLTVDYSEIGYEDLYTYVDGLFTNVRTFYSDIMEISIYSTNDTLPRDEYYFHFLDPENLPDWYLASKNGGLMYMENCGDGTICFTRMLNFYESGRYQTFVRIRILQDYLNELLDFGDDKATMVLFDSAGRITGSNQSELIGTQIYELSMDNQVVMTNETAHCGTLKMFTDRRRYDREAGRVASEIFLVFFVSSGLAFGAIYGYSRSFRKKVEKVLKGAQTIGGGALDYRIPTKGNDEIEKIALSVNQMGEQINDLIEESYKKELAQKSSELNLLQEQINPHFLYNALSSISSLALKNNDKETSKSIVYLSEFYRISLNKGKQELTIREELRLLEGYLKIQRMRFGDCIEVEYDLDETLLERRVMKLTLQPIVENAIHHGRTDDSEVFHILIRLFEADEKTVFEVIDDGCGIAPEKLMELQTSMNLSEGGYGLRNVNIRLKLQYGSDYGIYIESEPGFGTNVRIELPGKGADR